MAIKNFEKINYIITEPIPANTNRKNKTIVKGIR